MKKAGGGYGSGEQGRKDREETDSDTMKREGADAGASAASYCDPPLRFSPCTYSFSRFCSCEQEAFYFATRHD